MSTVPASPSAAVRLTAAPGGSVTLEVHAKPRAKKSRVVGVYGEALSLAIAAPPVDGAANEEVVRFVAELFGVAKGRVSLVRGASSRLKLLAVAGTTPEAMHQALDLAL